MTGAPPATEPHHVEEPDAGPSPAEGPSAGRNLLEWLAIVAGALLVAFLVKTFLIQAFFIPSASMQPELGIGDRVLVNKLSYRLHEVNRGDIVVFERPDCGSGFIAEPEIKDLIKRVIALPGETVEGRDGRVYVDGRALTEPYLLDARATSDFPAYEVPAGHVWVMGDNRANSKDSRVLCGGPTPIAEDDIVGRAFVSVWPVSSFGLL